MHQENSKMRTAFATVLAVCFTACFAVATASAATISVEETQLFGATLDDGAVTLDLTDFTTVSNDLLIVSFAQEHNDGAGGGISGVKYGGADMTLAAAAERENSASGDSNTALSSIWYVDPADGTSDITLTANSTSEGNIRFIASVLYVSGASGVVEASDTTEQDSVPVTAGSIDVSAGSLVVDAFSFPVGGGGTINSEGLAESGGTLLQKLDVTNFGGVSAFSMFGSSFLIPGSDQSLSTTWDHNSSSDEDGPTSLALASFAAIPEPATLALLGLGGAVMLSGRKRRGV